jgi:hypothetical protein
VAIRARLTVTGVQAAAKRVDDVGDRARRPEPALRSNAALEALKASERRRFSHGRGWRRISAEWVERKRRSGLDPRVMRASGALEQALTTGTGGVRRSVFNAELRWGIRSGEMARYGNVQANQGRRSVVIDVPAKAQIAERVQRFIAEGHT